MKIFLSGRYSLRDQLRSLREELHRLGHAVVSSWLDTEWERKDDHGSSVAPDAYREEHARKDMEDVAACDCLIAFTEEPRTSKGRGGRHVEYGMAAAWGKRLIVVGFQENIFHHLPGVEFHASQWDLLRALEG